MEKKCLTCHGIFYRKSRRSNAQWENTKYCTLTCRPVWNKGKKVGSLTASRTSFKKGIASWNKGLTTLSSGKKGKHYPNLQGSNHWNWQGDRVNKLARVRRSIEYKDWRKAVFERDSYTCQECFQRSGWLEADHIKQFAYYPELRFDLNNGRTLCRDCHYKKPIYSYQGNRKIVRLR